MTHSPLFDRVLRSMQLARFCEQNRISTREGLERRDAARHRMIGRRQLLGGAAAASVMLASGRGRAAPRRTNASIAIVGAGMAGLACADRLASVGIQATLYEARERFGGRQWSMGGSFASPVSFGGQVLERGGELVDNLHKTMLGYAQRFGLAREDMVKEWLPGEAAYYFDGQHVSEEVVVDEFRQLVDAMRGDLTQLSGEVLADYHTPFDEMLDYMSLEEYLVTRGTPPNAYKALDVSYTIEYGGEIADQSSLNMLFFIHADKRSRFTPFGVYSDERWHVVGGNQQIAEHLAASLPGPTELGARLVRVARRSDGRVELTFNRGGTTEVAVHDAVVLATPAPVLRDVDLDASLGIPDWRRDVIDGIQYGANAKMHVGFTSRFWGAHGSDGVSYSDLANHQNTWEPNPTGVSPGNAVLLDYSGGDRSAAMRPNQTDALARDFLADLDRIYPGARAAAKSAGPNRPLAHLQHWPSDPLTKGAYTCNQPGYFTTIAGLEGLPVGNVYFAGEHTDSFYEWQGFMEGAANSGIRAADEILADFR